MSVVIGASLQGVTAHQVVGKTNIKIIKPGSLNYLPLDFFSERGNLVSYKRIIKDLEIRLDRFGRQYWNSSAFHRRK